MLHVICTQLGPGHFSVCVRDSSQSSELYLWLQLLLFFIITNSLSQECEKAKTCANHLTQFQLIWMEFHLLLWLFGQQTLYFLLSWLFNIQERELHLCEFIKKNNFNIGLHSDIYRLISFISNLVWWWRSLGSAFWCELEWPWSSFKVTAVRQINNFSVHFSNFTVNFHENQYIAATCWFVEGPIKFLLHK